MNNSTIFVVFEPVPDKDVKIFLSDHALFGTRVSSLINRYAVEVPFGKEDHFKTLLSESSIVKSVSEPFLEGRPRRKFIPKKK